MTTSTSTNDIGCQEPTFRRALPYVATKGDSCIAFAQNEMHLDLDEWQKNWLRDSLAFRPDGLYTHMRNGLFVPRQNGKTGVVEARIAWGASVKGEKILYTAHDGSTVEKLLERLKEFFGEKANDPECRFRRLNKKVKRTRMKNGKEAFFFKNGGAIYLSTRTNSSKRGYTVDVVVFDESQELQSAQAKALSPTTTSAPGGNPQIYFLGTPPGPECRGDVIAAMRRNVIDGIGTKDTSWCEWAVDDVGDVYDVERMKRVNPAFGIRITERSILNVMGTLADDLSRAQECLGYWLPRDRANAVISAAEWDSCFTDDPPNGGAVVYAVKFSIDGMTGVVAACAVEDGKPAHVEIVDVRSMAYGMEWFERFFLERKNAPVVLDGGGNAKDLYGRLLNAGYRKKRLKCPTVNEFKAATSGFVNAVREGTVTHYVDAELDASATRCDRRAIGKDGFGFDSTTYGEAALVEACCLAHWGATKTDMAIKRETGVCF